MVDRRMAGGPPSGTPLELGNLAVHRGVVALDDLFSFHDLIFMIKKKNLIYNPMVISQKRNLL